MTNKPMIRIHDILTNEIIDREMTDLEFQQYEADQKTLAKEKVETEAKALAKSVLLEKLGITAEEAVLLIS